MDIICELLSEFPDGITVAAIAKKGKVPLREAEELALQWANEQQGEVEGSSKAHQLHFTVTGKRMTPCGNLSTVIRRAKSVDEVNEALRGLEQAAATPYALVRANSSYHQVPLSSLHRAFPSVETSFHTRPYLALSRADSDKKALDQQQSQLSMRSVSSSNVITPLLNDLQIGKSQSSGPLLSQSSALGRQVGGMAIAKTPPKQQQQQQSSPSRLGKREETLLVKKEETILADQTPAATQNTQGTVVPSSQADIILTCAAGTSPLAPVVVETEEVLFGASPEQPDAPQLPPPAAAAPRNAFDLMIGAKRGREEKPKVKKATRAEPTAAAAATGEKEKPPPKKRGPAKAPKEEKKGSLKALVKKSADGHHKIGAGLVDSDDSSSDGSDDDEDHARYIAQREEEVGEPPAPVIFSSVNDDIVLGTGVSFVATAAPATPAPSRPKPALAVSGTGQMTMGSFNNPELAAFKKEWVKKSETELACVGDEWVSTTVVVYCSSKTGEKISEDLFQQKVAELQRAGGGAAHERTPDPALNDDDIPLLEKKPKAAPAKKAPPKPIPGMKTITSFFK